MSLDLGVVIVALVVLVVAIAIAWWILAKLYQRSTTELSFVRTGFLGQRVVISGGALVIPVLHEVARINMNTVRIGVAHENERALITQDRMRVNVEADFYVRVEPTRDAVAAAAQTLGAKTLSPEALADLLEGKFTDALRSAAAEKSMEQLHENRHAFAKRVQALASDGLAKNGLGLESVSLSRLDQAGREFFNPNNAFDAAGLTKLTAEIEERRMRRNAIERDAQVAIQRKNLEAEQQMLELGREEEYARLSQEREIAIRRAQQNADVSRETAARKQDAEQADIAATEAVERAKLTSERAVREERVRVEQQIKEMEIARSRAVEIAEIDRRREIELAEQLREIDIAKQSMERSAAQAEAEAARASAVRAEESVISARDLERAERDKAVQLVQARRESEAKGIAALGAAQTQKKAAAEHAEALRLTADAEAAAEKLRAAAAQVRYEIDAAGRRALNDAENAQSPEAMALRAKLAAIERLEAIVAASVKPLEHIEGIRIVHLDGGLVSGGSGEPGSGSTSLSDQVMQSALKYKVQAPVVEQLLREAGIAGLDAAGVGKMIGGGGAT
jgi:uncharacterized membrane protein YqiK